MNNSILPRLGRALIVLAPATLAVVGAFAQNDGQDSRDQVTPQTVRAFYAQSHFFKVVVTDDAARVFPGQANNVYQNLPGAGPDGGAIAVVAGQGTLVNVRFSAESQCADGGADAGWCGIRILVNGVEAFPGPNADFAFDSTNNGADGGASWEAHAMERHICIPNPGGAVNVVPVQVQWRVFSSDGNTTAPSFRLDDWSLAIESAIASCSAPTAALESLRAP